MAEPISIYLLCGDEDYLVEEALGRVLGTIRSQVGEGLAVETVDCQEAGIDGVIREIESPSLFSINKVTVLKHLRLTKESRLASELGRSLSAGLAPGQFLVMVPDKVDRRLKLVRAIDMRGGMHEFGKLGGEGLRNWITQRFEEEGKSVSQGVAEKLVELKGDDLRVLATEIDKLVTYAGSKKSVGRKDVGLLVGRSRTERIFDLVNHVSLREVKPALAVLADLLDGGESAIGIVYMLARAVRWLTQVRLFLREESGLWKEGMQPREFYSRVLPRFKDWVRERDIPERDTIITHKPVAIYHRFREASGFQVEGLIDLLEKLLEANRLMVSTSVKGRVILERLIGSLGVV